jgi:hypothetical protein
LKEFTLDYKPVFSELPIQVDFSKEMLQPEAILQRRLVKKGNVKWERLTKSAATWEDWHALKERFPIGGGGGERCNTLGFI